MKMMDHDDRRDEADGATVKGSDDIKQDQIKSESRQCCCREGRQRRVVIFELGAICDMTYYD